MILLTPPSPPQSSSSSYTLPPPPYSNRTPPSPLQTKKGAPINNLPLHLLHRILSLTLDPWATPSRYDADEEEEKIRRIWAMFRALRGVDRRFYLVSISLLRNHFINLYTSLLIPPISSDPFPPDSAHLPSISHHQVEMTEIENVFLHRSRETAVFDRFIALRVGEDLRSMESELCEPSEGQREIFTRLQPQARLEDLLASLPSHLISHNRDRISSSSSSSSSQFPSTPTLKSQLTFPLPYRNLSVILSPQWAQLYLLEGLRGKSKTLLIQVRRRASLELTARHVGEGLQDLMSGLVELGGRVG